MGVAPAFRPLPTRSLFKHENIILKTIAPRISSDISSKITAKNGKRMGLELIKKSNVIEHEMFKNLLYLYFELSNANLSYDYVPSNIRANNKKLKLGSNNTKMKLDSNNIEVKPNTVTIEQSNKIKVIPESSKLFKIICKLRLKT